MTTDERERWVAPASVAGSTVLCLALASVAFGMAACRDRQADGPSALTIGVVPKGATHEHWKRVHIGAEKAAAEFRAKGVSVQVIWKGPLREDDREQQVQSSRAS